MEIYNPFSIKKFPLNGVFGNETPFGSVENSTRQARHKCLSGLFLHKKHLLSRCVSGTGMSRVVKHIADRVCRIPCHIRHTACGIIDRAADRAAGHTARDRWPCRCRLCLCRNRCCRSCRAHPCRWYYRSCRWSDFCFRRRRQEASRPQGTRESKTSFLSFSWMDFLSCHTSQRSFRAAAFFETPFLVWTAETHKYLSKYRKSS